MYLSRVRIENFRNFSELDISLSGNIVIVGENRVGKSNLVHALRLIFDPTLPESARQLRLADFWDGLGDLSPDDKIVVQVEIKDFESDPDVLAVLTDFRLDSDPGTVRLNYEYRPIPDLGHAPSAECDYEYICFGGESETKRLGHEMRRRIILDVLPALRDAEGDLAVWRRSPLRPLVEEAFETIDPSIMENVGLEIGKATQKLASCDEVKELENSIRTLLAAMSGPGQALDPVLGIAPSDPLRLIRAIQLLIDGGKRGIHDASVGSANLVFLTLKTLELKSHLEQDRRDHTFLAIEEPEAHLHPHLQRTVYKQLFLTAAPNKDEPVNLSIIMTTHSPHIASVAPLRSLVLLKDAGDDGTVGRSTAPIGFTEPETEDLSRYLDVTRAEILFARGVILVEGDAERFLVPAFADTLGLSLDQLGISVCSVSGTNFRPYAKLLTGLDIPFSVITDWDPGGDEDDPLGWNRSLEIAVSIEKVRTGEEPEALRQELDAFKDANEFAERCEQFGVFSNLDTLEVDLFKGGFSKAIRDTLAEASFGKVRMDRVNGWVADPKTLNRDQFLAMIDEVGKGRFAQRLATRVGSIKPPAYIKGAIEYVVNRV